MTACGPISYVAIGAVALLAFVLVAAICAVVLAHRARTRTAYSDPFFDPDYPLASPGRVERFRAVQK